jgi:hypothetical protein
MAKTAMAITLLLGAEGCSELEQAGTSWCRDATSEEIESLHDFDEGVKELLVDGMGRPYFYKTITDDAPNAVLEKYRDTLRTVRL